MINTVASGNVVNETLGNSVTRKHWFDGETNRIRGVHGTKFGAGNIQDLSYRWDTLGNLEQRRDQSGSKNLTENFTYDDLNRLKTSQVVGRSRKDVTYDSYGNIRSKTGVGTYSYSNARPNAVSAAGGVTYAYDDNGNNTSSSDGRVITYNTFDKVKSAAKGGHTTSFKYGPDRARYKRIDTKSGNTTTTLYIGNVEKITYPNNTRAIKRYIDGLVIKTLNYNSGRTLTSTDTHYTLSDHLGSVDVITSGSGVITQQLSFDAWGLRRNAVNWQDLAASSITNFDTDLTRRGFTGHEHMDEVGIIHMNGRIYDPRLGRFLQADAFVPDPGNVASHNRYSYVYNNPLNATDPSGHFVFTLAAAILVAAEIIIIEYVVLAFALAEFADALAQGASFGEAIKAGIISGVTAAAFAGVSGAFTDVGWASGSFIGELSVEGFGATVAVHGVIGGISSVLSGGKFGHGFASAGLTAAATMFSHSKFPKTLSKAGPRVVINATIGGTASKLSGGKFANGAVTAAFAAAVQNTVANANKPNFSEMTKEQRVTWVQENADRLALDFSNVDHINLDYINEHVLTVLGDGTPVACDGPCGGNETLADFNRGELRLFAGAFEGGYAKIFRDIQVPPGYPDGARGANGLTVNYTPMEQLVHTFGHELAHSQGINIPGTPNYHPQIHPGAERAGLEAVRNFRRLK